LRDFQQSRVIHKTYILPISYLGMLQEADNILRIMREGREALEKKDSYKLKVLSDQTVHTATIYQDADSIVVAVLAYSLAKIVERESYQRMEGWDAFYSSLLKNMDSAILSLEVGDYEKFMDYLGEIRNSINKIAGDLSGYIRDIFYKAEINKAFRLYEHGLSAEKTASVLGVSLWDLASYIGQSTVSESHLNEAIPVKERIKLAEDFFK
jgi:hypothetical protein